MGRVEHCKQISLVCVGECLQCMDHTGFAPVHNAYAFPVYTFQAVGWFAGVLSEAGPGLLALPRSKLLRFRFLGTPQRHRGPTFCALPLSEQLRQPGAW